LEVHPVFSLPDYPAILPLTSDYFTTAKNPDSNWHADTTFRPEPSSVSILLARVSPSLGGDTVFANAAAAYAGLDEAIKALIDGLSAIHDARIFTRFLDSEEEREELLLQHEAVEHPVVRIHPETGEKVLFVNPVFTRSIV